MFEEDTMKASMPTRFKSSTYKRKNWPNSISLQFFDSASR